MVFVRYEAYDAIIFHAKSIGNSGKRSNSSLHRLHLFHILYLFLLPSSSSPNSVYSAQTMRKYMAFPVSSKQILLDLPDGFLLRKYKYVRIEIRTRMKVQHYRLKQASHK